MNDIGYALRLQRLTGRWSDRLEKPASQFADDHRDLYPRRITNAQLYGLQNIVRNTRHFAGVQRFVRHQGEKADRSGRWDVREYWNDLLKTLSKLESEAQFLQEQVGSPPSGDNTKLELDELHCQLIEEFVQHLIAHSLYWTPERQDRKHGR